jgi:hypothetical protein
MRPLCLTTSRACLTVSVGNRVLPECRKMVSLNLDTPSCLPVDCGAGIVRGRLCVSAIRIFGIMGLVVELVLIGPTSLCVSRFVLSPATIVAVSLLTFCTKASSCSLSMSLNNVFLCIAVVCASVKH